MVKWGVCVSIKAVWVFDDSGSGLGLLCDSEGLTMASEGLMVSSAPSSVCEAAVGVASVSFVEAPC